MTAPRPTQQARLTMRPSNDNAAIESAQRDSAAAFDAWRCAMDRVRSAVREFGRDSITAARARLDEQAARERYDAALWRLTVVVRGGSV